MSRGRRAAPYDVEIVSMALYDVGRSIDLKAAASLVPGSPGMRIARRRDTPSSLTIPAPLCVDLGAGPGAGSGPVAVSASARLYDEGVITVIVRSKIRATLEEMHGDMVMQAVVDQRYRAIYERVKPAIVAARDDPERETYLAFCFADVGKSPDLFMAENDRALTTLLTGEPYSYPIHGSQIQKTMGHQFSYGEGDRAVFDLDRAVIIDAERDYEDVLLICELANYQFLELRALDRLLDRWLDEAEDDVAFIAKRYGAPRAGALRRKLGTIQALRLDAMFVLENLENSAKIIGDYFLGQVYEHVCGIFNTSGWTRSVERRLDALENVYEIVKVQRNERTMLVLEIVFIIVCVIPIIQFALG